MIEPSLEGRFSSAAGAIAALDKPQATLPALVVRKPGGSKIQLTKNWDSLEIIIPPSGFHPSIVLTGLFAIAWNSFILFWTIGALSAPFPANIPFALFSLPFWAAGCSMVYKFIFNLFGRICLRLNAEQISLTWELFSWKFERPRHPQDKVLISWFTFQNTLLKALKTLELPFQHNYIFAQITKISD
jgi:hypothetical protein